MRRLDAALRGTPADRHAAAGLIGAIARDVPEALADLRPGAVVQAAAINALGELGYGPERAVERAKQIVAGGTEDPDLNDDDDRGAVANRLRQIADDLAALLNDKTGIGEEPIEAEPSGLDKHPNALRRQVEPRVFNLRGVPAPRPVPGAPAMPGPLPRQPEIERHLDRMLTLWRLLIALQEAIIRGALLDREAHILPAQPPQDEPANDDRERWRTQDPEVPPPSGHNRPPGDPPPPLPPVAPPPQRSAPTRPEPQQPRAPQQQEQAPPPARPNPRQGPPIPEIVTALAELARRILADRNSAPPLGSDTDDPDEMRRRRDAFEGARRSIDWTQADFKTPTLLTIHFQKHRQDWNGRLNVQNEQEYRARARALLSQPIGNGIEGALRANGDVLIYNRNTGEFAVAAADGTIRTYYIPEGAHQTPMDHWYWEREIAKPEILWVMR